MNEDADQPDDRAPDSATPDGDADREEVSSRRKDSQAAGESSARPPVKQTDGGQSVEATLRSWAQGEGAAALSAAVEQATAPLRAAKLNWINDIELPVVPALNTSSILSENALTNIRNLSVGSTAFQEAVDAAIKNLDITEFLREIGNRRITLASALNEQNQPHHATSSQTYLASTEELRHREPGPVWHYTNGYALIQVLTNHYIWASTPQTLNDSSEIKHGLDIIRSTFQKMKGHLEQFVEAPQPSPHKLGEVKKTIQSALKSKFFEPILDEVFFISASRESDSLTLWRNYANGDGFAIGIDPLAPLSIQGLTDDPNKSKVDVRAGIPVINGWYRIQYEDDEKSHHAENFLKHAIQDAYNTKPANKEGLKTELRKQVLILASTMKHEAFRDEREVRWMTTNWADSNQLHYEHARNRISPILHIMTPFTNPDLTPEHLPITGIRCSPLNPLGISSTIQGLLKKNGYCVAVGNVKQSELPYRG